jgi:antitoxin HigA-1
MKIHNPAHPGELLSEYLDAGDITITEMAERIGVSRKLVSELVHGKARITVPMSRKLGRALNTTPGIWLRLQQQRDEWEISRMPDRDLKHIKPFPQIEA